MITKVRTHKIPIIYGSLGWMRKRQFIITDSIEDLQELDQYRNVFSQNNCISYLDAPDEFVIKMEAPDNLFDLHGITGVVLNIAQYYFKIDDVLVYDKNHKPNEAVFLKEIGINEYDIIELCNTKSCIPLLKKLEECKMTEVLSKEKILQISTIEKELTAYIELLQLKGSSLKIEESFCETHKETEDVLYNESYKLNAIEVNGKAYGIFDLQKRMDEAIFASIRFFDKKCPYCGTSLYEGHIRSKIEIDHFFPISHGGQDFPWNVLPVCKDCNRKKSDKMPYIFLKKDRYTQCYNFLLDQKERVTDYYVKTLMDVNIILEYIKENHERIKSNSFEILTNICNMLTLEIETNNKKNNELKSFDFYIEMTKVVDILKKRKLTNYIMFSATSNEIRFAYHEIYDALYRKRENNLYPMTKDIFKNNLFELSGCKDKIKQCRINNDRYQCIVFNFEELEERYKDLFIV